VIQDFDVDGLPASFDCDALVVGAGPAGIVLGLELARRRPDWHIIVVEGGGRGAPTAAELDLYAGETGEKFYALPVCRLRLLGGTSNHWGGWCRPLDGIDFEAKPHMAHSGWPFGLSELAPYYRDAQRWCEIDSDDYSPRILQGRLLPLDESQVFRHQLFRFSPPTRFGRRYEEDIAASPNLRLILHANAIRFDRAGDRVAGVRFRSLAGRGLRVGAHHTVLAMGGLESTRFLLNHTPTDGTGAAGRSFWMGRGFADHFGLGPGEVLAPAGLHYERTDDRTGPLMPVISPTPEAIRERGWQNSCLQLWPLHQESLVGSDYAGNPSLGFTSGEYWLYRASMILEPTPNPDSRVSLSTQRDALGLRRLRLDWRIAASDFERAQRTFAEFARELGRLGLGRARLAQLDIPQLQRDAGGVCHHLGTLRMADRPEDGVVTPDLRVHDRQDLYVLSSAVFPSYGFSNPTLTVVALAVRLAERLAGPTPGRRM